MALRTTYSAESWDKIYQAFAAVSFVSYDFDSIKQSLLDYTRLYYPEQFNDYIQSSEFIMFLEMFAYIAEQLAYRIDMVAHENFITTAQRKQSILRLAKLISYKATRNIPVRGLVKLNTISTSERVLDSRGIDLSGITITWNDSNNPNWKEQFILVMNKVLSTRFGQPQKTREIGDVVMDLYTMNNIPSALRNGVIPFSVSTGLESYPIEIVPADVDENGPFEREPDLVSSMSLIYANDGVGDGSDYTGFLMFVKQGVLARIDYNIDEVLPNRQIDFIPQNVNHTDIWVQRMNPVDGSIQERWVQVDTIAEQNLVFNDRRDTRRKYEIDTRENDQITVVFGDGDFSDAPIGSFRFWMRQSANRNIVIQKNKIVNEQFSLSYTSSLGNIETFNATFSLTSTLQNGSATETIEHIRRSAPATYYAQNRIVNGQDANTFMLKDPTILRLKTVNRTFAGQPKYIDWNDASGQYENVKLFGDDLVMRYQMGFNTISTSTSGRSLIDEVIEPLLKTPGVLNTLLHISASDPLTNGIVSAPRRSFIEDNRSNRYKKIGGASVTPRFDMSDGSLKEKTAIQGLIDKHWYGEPLSIALDANGNTLAVIPNPTMNPADDSRIYDALIPRSIDGVNKFPPGDTGSGTQSVGEQRRFGLRYNRLMAGIGNGSIVIHSSGTAIGATTGEVWTIEVQADGTTVAVRSNVRGTFPAGTIGNEYQLATTNSSAAIPFFTVSPGTIPFAAGDAFILDTLGTTLDVNPRSSLPSVVNLNGWWEMMRADDMPDYSGVPNPQVFTTSNSITPNLKQHSWVLLVKQVQNSSNQVIGYEVYHRDLKLTVESATTKFWFNEVDQILDGETKKRVYDNIRVLGSNLNSMNIPLRKNQMYDVVGPVSYTGTNTNLDGTTNFNRLEVVPTDLLQEDASGDLIPDRILQFEMFGKGSYEYFNLSTPSVLFSTDPTPGNWASGSTVNNARTHGRNLRMPSLSSNGNTGLDFMWQHFSPFTNIIDPSPTNIHDAYVMTRGYYDSVISYVRGTSVYAPTAPTPLELQNSYGYLLKSKMLSDTIVLHPGKIKLLFGGLSNPEFRAKFKVVRAQSATLTNERIKEEILNVINTYFDIDGWDFGDTFYATELISLIHQRLPTDVASVVLVPVYSTNSFGSMFTVESGIDEILQSSAELSDIVIVDALTPTVIRQVI